MGYEKVLALSSVYNYSLITEELLFIRNLTKQADEISSKHELEVYLAEVSESLHIIQRELARYDLFVNMLRAD
jgi:hypothetical protein